MEEPSCQASWEMVGLRLRNQQLKQETAIVNKVFVEMLEKLGYDIKIICEDGTVMEPDSYE